MLNFTTLSCKYNLLSFISETCSPKRFKFSCLSLSLFVEKSQSFVKIAISLSVMFELIPKASASSFKSYIQLNHCIFKLIPLSRINYCLVLCKCPVTILFSLILELLFTVWLVLNLPKDFGKTCVLLLEILSSSNMNTTEIKGNRF